MVVSQASGAPRGDLKQRSDAALFGVVIYQGVEPIDIGASWA